MSSQILLYSGSGSDPFCVNSIERQLQELSDSNQHQIRRVNDFSNCWTDPKSIKTVVIPGGNATTMWINGGIEEQALVIKSHLEKYKISYFGICAGAILATSQYFEQYNFLDQTCNIDNRPDKFLDIYKGTVVAPIFPKLVKPLSFDNFKPCDITTIKTNTCVNLGFILGPAFLDCDKILGAEILSTYNQLPILKFIKLSWNPLTCTEISEIKADRIAESVLYKGENSSTVLLTAGHLEIDSQAVASDGFKRGFPGYKNLNPLIQEFKRGDAARKKLLKSNFELLGITCK